MLKSSIRYLSHLGVGGLAQAVKGRLFGGQAIVSVRPAEIAASVFLRVPSSDVLAFAQIFQGRQYQVLARRPPRVIVDAGANIGLASVFFANKFPEATIIAVEPEPANFAMLVRNAAPYPNISPVNAALWNADGLVNILDNGLGSWGFVTESIGADSNQDPSSHVRAMTMVTLFASCRLTTIDLLKIDIEGAEKEVFESAGSWINQVDALMVELHDRLKEGCSRSFYNGSNGFDREWVRGDTVFLSRNNVIEPVPDEQR